MAGRRGLKRLRPRGYDLQPAEPGPDDNGTMDIRRLLFGHG
jgi:hypothetical protein